MDSPEMLVCQALQAATNSDHRIVQKAEAQLSEWEQQPGFFPTLARLSLKTSPAAGGDGTAADNANVRWMAAVYLKNAVDRHWRRNQRVDLTPEQKQQIRAALLQHFWAEDVPQVALQVAVLMSRIARFDCPQDWPDLIPELLKLLQNCDSNTNAQRQQRVLLTLHHVIKALASRRIMAEKRQFCELTENIIVYILKLWDNLTSEFMNVVKTQPEALSLSWLERAHIVTRSLRKLVAYGFKKAYKSQECMNLIPQIFQRLRETLELRYHLLQAHFAASNTKGAMRGGCEGATPLLERLEHFILKMMKLLHDFLSMHELSFVRFVPVALEFSFHYVFHEGTALIFNAEEQVINFPSFAILALNLIKSIMQCNTYTLRAMSPNHSEESEMAAAAVQTQADFFTNDRISYICDKMLTYYLLLTPQELDEWQQDPESFGQDDSGGDSWRYALRPCVESLYLVFFSQHTELMTSEVGKFVRKAQQLELSADSELKTILQKDAIYNAAALASFNFYHEIDFGAWFSTQLLSELRIDSPNFRILRRRIIWMLGEWVGVQFPKELRPLAYEACLHLLRGSEDMSIRLAASRTVNSLIDDFEFAPKSFLPYVAPIFDCLSQLLRDAKECDTKIVVLMTMSLIVNKMSDFIEPQAAQLISYLPMLWKESEEYNMLRCAIISTLEQLVEAIRDIPEPMKPFLYNVIEYSTDLEKPSHIYLMEDGIMLWNAVVENSTAMTPEMFALCKHIMPIIEASSENLRSVLQLIHGYILLDAESFLTHYGNHFVSYCVRTFEDIRLEGIMTMLRIFETCLKSDPIIGLQLVRPALPYVFKQVYANSEYPMVMSHYLMMVARTLLINQTEFMSVVQELQHPNSLEIILDVWLERMPVIRDMEKRKLFCLAFASIFSNNDMVLKRFPSIMLNIRETLIELMCEESEDTEDEQKCDKHVDETTVNKSKPTQRFYDLLVIQDENDLDATPYVISDFSNKSYHFGRCRALALKDPVHQISLTEYLNWQLTALAQQMGETRFQQLLQTVDPEALEKILNFIKQSLKQGPSSSSHARPPLII